MSTIDITQVAGLQAVNAEGNVIGTLSINDLTELVADKIVQEVKNEAVSARSASVMSEASTLETTDEYEDQLALDTNPAYVRSMDSEGNPKRTATTSLATVVGELSGYSRIAMKEVTIPPNSAKNIDALGYTDFLAINLSSGGGAALFLIGKASATKLIVTNIPDFGIAFENDTSKSFYATYINGYAVSLYNNTKEEVKVYYRWLMIGR